MIKYIKIIFHETFYVLTGAFVVFAIMEIVWPNVVLAYINVNWLLIFWLIVGIFIVIFNKENEYD